MSKCSNKNDCPNGGSCCGGSCCPSNKRCGHDGDNEACSSAPVCYGYDRRGKTCERIGKECANGPECSKTGKGYPDYWQCFQGDAGNTKGARDKCIKSHSNSHHPPAPTPGPAPPPPHHDPKYPSNNNHHNVVVKGNQLIITNNDGSDQTTVISVTPSSVTLSTTGVAGDDAPSSLTNVPLTAFLKQHGWSSASDPPIHPEPLIPGVPTPCIPVHCTDGSCSADKTNIGLLVGIPLLMIIVILGIMLWKKGKHGKSGKSGKSKKSGRK